MALRLVDEARARVVAEPNNLNHYRAVAQAYRQLGRTDDALDWVRKARAQPAGAADPTLAKEESELQTALLEARVKGATGEARAAAQAELDAWRLTEAKRTVERYPNDFPARLALGELHLAAGEIDAALAQFQQAQKGPQVRVAALVGMGRGFKAKRIFDLAVMQFNAAKAELGAMDDVKKAVVYELGTCFEAMGKAEEAIAEFKLIYGEDIGYRDVGEKITAHYSR
jgi:tetratricopeptide (TPR) repeat protein